MRVRTLIDSRASSGAEEPAQHQAMSGPASLLLHAAVLLSLLCTAGLLVYGSGRGLDLTDEIFYLIWTDNPNAYALLYQPFGYLLHPLFELVGRNLQAYRLTGIAVTAATGAFLGHSLPCASLRRRIFALYGALAALTIYFPWIVTPSYNSAANVGAMLVIGGLLKCLQSTGGMRLVGALVTGVGLCVAAYSKPPLFAIAVAAIVLGCVMMRRARRSLILSLAIAAALMSLFFVPWELPALVRRMIASQHVLALPNTPMALPAKVVHDWLAVPLPLTIAAVSAALSFALRHSRWWLWPAYAAIASSVYYVATIIPDAIDGSVPDFLGLAVVLIATGYLALIQHEDGIGWWLVAILFIAPFAVGLGTFNNQWFQLNFSMAFPFLALFALAAVDPASGRRAAAQAVAILGPAAVMLLAAWAPYSLPSPIFEQQNSVRPPFARGTVLVDDETESFMDAAQGRARGALMIDLSGTGPGVVAVLGGRAPVLPWLNPATPTWPDVVWSRLSVSERERAWFVLPFWPGFEHSAPARWVLSHKNHFCRSALPPITFWGDERTLEILRPCAPAARAGPSYRPNATPA